jgi:hypothetical protein
LVPVALMALPVRLGFGFLRAGSFFVLHGLCGIKSFVGAACPPQNGQDTAADADRPGG